MIALALVASLLVALLHGPERWGADAAGLRKAGFTFPTKRRVVGAAWAEGAYVLPTEMGVEHYQVMGVIRNETVVAHVYARFSGRLAHRHFYGKAWIEYEKGTRFMPFHAKYVDKFPKMFLKGAETGSVFELSIVRHHELCVHVEGSFQDNSTSYVLQFEGWRRTQYLRPYEWRGWLRDRHFQSMGELPQVVAVYMPLDAYAFNTNIRLVVKVFTYNIEYHRRLGYTGFIAYLRPRMIEGVLNSPILRNYVNEGLLLLVYWDEFPMQGHGPYTDQWPSYYHAAVALSGEHVLIHFLDMDDFLGADQPIHSVQALLRTCMGNRGHLRLYEINYRITKSLIGSNGKWWSEGDAWLAPDVLDPLKLYREARILWNNATGQHFASKFLASPSVLLNFNNHYVVVKKDAESRDVHHSCAYIVHLVCVYWRREDHIPWDSPPNWFWLHTNDTIVM